MQVFNDITATELKRAVAWDNQINAMSDRECLKRIRALGLEKAYTPSTLEKAKANQWMQIWTQQEISQETLHFHNFAWRFATNMEHLNRSTGAAGMYRANHITNIGIQNAIAQNPDMYLRIFRRALVNLNFKRSKQS